MSTAPEPKFIATSDEKIATGALIFWQLSGTVDIKSLTDAWIKAGLKKSALPAMPSPEVALRRAVDDQRIRRRGTRSVLARQAGRKWCLVEERREGDDDLEYTIELKAWLDNGKLVVEPEDHKLVSKLRTAFEYYLTVFTSTDVSMWLVSLVRRTQAVSLRDGLYFVPKQFLPRWRLCKGVLGNVSQNRIREVPMLQGEEAVEMVLDAVKREAEAAANAMEDELMVGSIGERALHNRVEDCVDMERKVAAYGKLLSANTAELRDRLKDLRARLAVAALAAETNAA